MKEQFTSLARARRDMREGRVSKRWWRRVSSSVVVSAISLCVSLATATLSYWHFKMDEDARQQPYRSAFYSVKLESYQRSAVMVSDWINIVSGESELDAALLNIRSAERFSDQDSASLLKRSDELGKLTVKFYRGQVMERLYWPKVRTDFDTFDKSIDRITKCSAFIVGIVKYNRSKLQMKVSNAYLIDHFDRECHFRRIARDGDMAPYAKLLAALARDLGLASIRLEETINVTD